MSGTNAKSIELVLYDGSLNGIVYMADPAWNSGQMYSVPREYVSTLMKDERLDKFGVYLLLSETNVYVGQSNDLAARALTHLTEKDWWKRIIFLTTTDNNLDSSDIDYLEAVLIENADKVFDLQLVNKKKGEKRNPRKGRKIILDMYLEEALLLLQMIGVKVKKPVSQGKRPGAEKTDDIRKRLLHGKYEGAAAVLFIENQGIKIGKRYTYAVLQGKKDEFWANPNVSFLNEDWWIVLNNNISRELIVIKVPARILGVNTGRKKGLLVRKDNPHRIDMNINAETLIDRKSKIDFSKWVENRFRY